MIFKVALKFLALLSKRLETNFFLDSSSVFSSDSRGQFFSISLKAFLVPFATHSVIRSHLGEVKFLEVKLLGFDRNCEASVALHKRRANGGNFQRTTNCRMS